jgi:hypothetical protein
MVKAEKSGVNRKMGTLGRICRGGTLFSSLFLARAQETPCPAFSLEITGQFTPFFGSPLACLSGSAIFAWVGPTFSGWSASYG